MMTFTSRAFFYPCQNFCFHSLFFWKNISVQHTSFIFLDITGPSKEKIVPFIQECPYKHLKQRKKVITSQTEKEMWHKKNYVILKMVLYALENKYLYEFLCLWNILHVTKLCKNNFHSINCGVVLIDHLDALALFFK